MYTNEPCMNVCLGIVKTICQKYFLWIKTYKPTFKPRPELSCTILRLRIGKNNQMTMVRRISLFTDIGSRSIIDLREQMGIDRLHDKIIKVLRSLWAINTNVSLKSHFKLISRSKIRLCKQVWMKYYDFKVFYGGLRQNLHHLQVYSCVPGVNGGETGKMQVNTLDSGWIHLKVGIQFIILL